MQIKAEYFGKWCGMPIGSDQNHGVKVLKKD